SNNSNRCVHFLLLPLKLAAIARVNQSFPLYYGFADAASCVCLGFDEAAPLNQAGLLSNVLPYDLKFAVHLYDRPSLPQYGILKYSYIHAFLPPQNAYN